MGRKAQSSMTTSIMLFCMGVSTSLVFTPFFMDYGRKYSLKPPPIRMEFWEDRFAKNATLGGNTLDALHDQVKIACIVKTSANKAAHMKNVWLKRCNIGLFVSFEKNEDFPVIPLKEGSDAAITGFRYALEHHGHEADWFLATDTETYVVLENLRDLLKNGNPRDPVYYGTIVAGDQKSKLDEKAGYVLSKAAVQRVIETSKYLLADETAEIGNVIEKAGVKFGNSKDLNSRELFHSHDVAYYVSLPAIGHAGKTCEGLDCTTSHPITFAQVSLTDMYVLEYMFCKARVIGRCVHGYST